MDLSAKCSRNVIDFTDNQRTIIKKFFSSDDNHRKVNFANRYTKFVLETKDRPIPTVFLDIKKIFCFEDGINISGDDLDASQQDYRVKEAENINALTGNIRASKNR